MFVTNVLRLYLVEPSDSSNRLPLLGPKINPLIAIHRTAEGGRHPWRSPHPVPLLLTGRDSWNRFLRTTSCQVFNTSKDGDCTAFLGSPWQCLATLTENFFLRFKCDFFHFDLCLLSLDSPFVSPRCLLLVLSLSLKHLQEDLLRHRSGVEVRLTGLFPESSFSSTERLKCPSVPVVTASVEPGNKLRGQRTSQHLSFLPEDHLLPCVPSVTSLGGTRSLLSSPPIFQKQPHAAFS